MSISPTLTRTAWDDMASPEELSADCRAAEAEMGVPTRRAPAPAAAPDFRFDQLSEASAKVSYELD